MQNIEQKTPLANNHISVDCVVIGFDGEQLKVLLIKRAGEEEGEILKNVNLMQFKAFGSKNRTKDPRDVHWLERAMQSKVERIVTIAYLSLVKIDRALNRDLDNYQASWVAMPDIKALAFDHNLIIKEAITYVRQYVEFNPSSLFDLLPRKFTASQLRTLYELVYDKQYDVRNFHKKIALMEYVVPLEEKQQGVAHRAARYYRFDKKIYNKIRR